MSYLSVICNSKFKSVMACVKYVLVPEKKPAWHVSLGDCFNEGGGRGTSLTSSADFSATMLWNFVYKLDISGKAN